MITGINYLRIFSVMITDWETNFTDLQANDFGNLGKKNSGNILVSNHAVIFTEINSPRIFSVGHVCVDNGTFGEITFTFREIMFTFAEIRFTLGDSRRFRVLGGISFVSLLEGFGTLWAVGGL